MPVGVKVPVIESERGWGNKIDDWMVCQSDEMANAFIKEFNSKNNENTTPDWYMYADNVIVPHDLSDEQYKKLLTEEKMWLSQLNKLT